MCMSSSGQVYRCDCREGSGQLVNRLLSRLPVLAADALVLAVAMLGALRSRRVAVKSNINTRLSTYVLRHGSLYFLILLTLNILYIVQSVTALQLNVLD
ncbi:hypothetical protein A0H81_07290 [Grifola frondosa]|uniref:Uncharacterized protein n=1 Tax=Grifola frondosa TaxID=5627 RepID=A0A1C7M984_GRIFR|nr:hypothetical protein A0H81_07290 [Grifola frondosa]